MWQCVANKQLGKNGKKGKTENQNWIASKIFAVRGDKKYRKILRLNV